MCKSHPEDFTLPSHSKKTRRPHGAQADIEILFEDQDLIVVVKPAGLLTIATDREKRRTAYAMLVDHVRRFRAARIFIVHRLDREASGLLVFAKNEQAKAALQSQFQDHSAGRTYLAVTDGRVPQDTFTVKSYIAENAAYRCYSTRDAARGQLAVTHITVLQRTPLRTLVEARLETGRKHQIRVHLADEGFPIVGDPAYGSGKSPIRRMALHGAKLVFRHPHTGEAMTFTSPAPTSFDALMRIATPVGRSGPPQAPRRNAN